jgi:hypothetical protein
MLTLDRRQIASLAVLAIVLLGCGLAVAVSLGARSEASQEFVERQELLARLQAQPHWRTATAATMAPEKAPRVAFVEAQTAGLAGALLQSHVARIAQEQHAVLISSGIEPAGRDDTPDSIRMQATFELNIKSLQGLLYELESGVPYVFVETLAVQPAGQRGGEDPILRLTLGMRTLWRRG